MFELAVATLAVLLFLWIVFKTMTFRVPDMQYGVVSSAISGRYAGRDAQGREIVWKRNYDEGLYFRWPWWRARYYSKQIRIHPIAKREFMIPGGSVLVSGIVQWVPSFHFLQKFEEIPEKTIDLGLDSEVDKIIREGLIDLAGSVEKDSIVLDKVVLSGPEITRRLEDRLMGTDLHHGDGKDTERTIFSEKISYTENLWGVTVVRSSIDTIEPAGDLRKARDQQSKEEFEKRSQTVEFEHFIGRMKGLKEALPGVPDGEVVEAIQVWQKQATKQIHSFRGEGNLGGLMGLASMFTGQAGKGQKDKEDKEEKD